MAERKDLPVLITCFATDRQGAKFIRAEVYSATERVRRELRVPPPAEPMTSGIEVPYLRGEIWHPDGTRTHIISWHNVIHGGGPVLDRKLMKASGITTVGTNGQNGNGRR